MSVRIFKKYSLLKKQTNKQTTKQQQKETKKAPAKCKSLALVVVICLFLCSFRFFGLPLVVSGLLVVVAAVAACL